MDEGLPPLARAEKAERRIYELEEALSEKEEWIEEAEDECKQLRKEVKRLEDLDEDHCLIFEQIKRIQAIKDGLIDADPTLEWERLLDMVEAL